MSIKLSNELTGQSGAPCMCDTFDCHQWHCFCKKMAVWQNRPQKIQLN